MNFKEEILKSIQLMIDKSIGDYKADRTYRAVIKGIDKNGYVITDQAGQERIVPCGIPNTELRPGQSVYVKEPMGRINELHICNLAGNMSNLNRGSRRG